MEACMEPYRAYIKVISRFAGGMHGAIHGGSYGGMHGGMHGAIHGGMHGGCLELYRGIHGTIQSLL